MLSQKHVLVTFIYILSILSTIESVHNNVFLFYLKFYALYFNSDYYNLRNLKFIKKNHVSKNKFCCTLNFSLSISY